MMIKKAMAIYHLLKILAGYFTIHFTIAKYTATEIIVFSLTINVLIS